MELLYVLLVLLVLTRAFGELAARVGMPALVGELVSGIVLGLVAREYSESLPVLARLGEDEVFVALTDLAVFVLMLLAGIEMHPRRLLEASGSALVIALAGMLVPLALGTALGFAFLPASDYRIPQALFLGTALAITAVPVSVKVLMDLGRLESRAGQLIVSAAIFDDVLSLILLAVLTALIRTGELPGALDLLWLLGQVAIFFAATSAIGLLVLPRIGRLLERLIGDELEFSALLIVGLAFAVLAELLSMHFIVGAFLAGLFFTGRSLSEEIYEDVKRKLSALTTGFLAPIFFASIGIHLELSAVTAVPVFVTLLVVAAFAGKLLGGGLAARAMGIPGREALVVGVGISARGAVELVIAGIALRAGLFAHPEPTPTLVASLFSAVVVMAIVTTLLVPIVLKRLLD